MQTLANMTTHKDYEIGPMLGRNTTGKYAMAKASFVASSGSVKKKRVGIGGMFDPHLPITYYLIVYNNFVDKV